MDAHSQNLLAQLIRQQRVASLGTLRDGGPLVSLALYAPAADFSAFYLHISRLAHHTQDILQDARVSLMIAAQDNGAQDPQTLPRLSLRGEATLLPADAPATRAIQELYLARFPQARPIFSLTDFALCAIHPHTARFVAGFGKIFNLSLEHLVQASAQT